MSSGQKQCAIDDEEEAWARHLEKVKKIHPVALTNLIEKIHRTWFCLEHHKLRLTAGQHSILAELDELLRLLP